MWPQATGPKSKPGLQAKDGKDNLTRLAKVLTESGWKILRGFLDANLAIIKSNPSIALLPIYYLIRATGITIQSGQTGLLFSFGRARKELGPGFRLLIPFLQVVRVLPTRSRTMDLPAQEVVTLEGLVYIADANLVFRITDVRKALIQIDNLDRGMHQMLALSVQKILRGCSRSDLRVSEELDKSLEQTMGKHLQAWGVIVEHAGFTSITPSPVTLRLTQLGKRTHIRSDLLKLLESGDLNRAVALTLLGTKLSVFPHRKRSLMREELQRKRRRIRKLVRKVAQQHKIRDQRRIKYLTRRALFKAGVGGVVGEEDLSPAKPDAAASAV